MPQRPSECPTELTAWRQKSQCTKYKGQYSDQTTNFDGIPGVELATVRDALHSTASYSGVLLQRAINLCHCNASYPGVHFLESSMVEEVVHISIGSSWQSIIAIITVRRLRK